MKTEIASFMQLGHLAQQLLADFVVAIVNKGKQRSQSDLLLHSLGAWRRIVWPSERFGVSF